jgi:rRNA maturation protein Nop10
VIHGHVTILKAINLAVNVAVVLKDQKHLKKQELKMSDLKQYSAVIGGIAIRWCPKCQIYNSGNYCNICGGKLEEKKPMEKECPCCGGSGKIPYYPHPSIPMYTYMNYNNDENSTNAFNPYNISE